MRPKDTFPSQPGAYLIILQIPEKTTLRIGHLGEYHFENGYYAYIGSAQGPGGLAGRIHRHLRPKGQKQLHWHLDYILPYSRIRQIWWAESTSALECAWAASLSQIGFQRIPGFGASDCHCGGHFIHLGGKEKIEQAWSYLAANTTIILNRNGFV